MSNKSERMYQFSREQRNPMVGCLFGCTYCAFKRITQRFDRDCPDCKTFIPHYHLNRIEKGPKKTQGKEFISLCLNGDISFASDDFIKEMIMWCEMWADRTILIQSKDPARFLSFKFPKNVVLGTTIETDSKILPYFSLHHSLLATIPYSQISKAPHPEIRHLAMNLIHNNDVHITIEPILDFDLDVLIDWMQDIPMLKVINIGYDSRPELNHLPEPPLQKTEELIARLEPIAEVRRKQIRKAWWE
jgi:hypothetical protein